MSLSHRTRRAALALTATAALAASLGAGAATAVPEGEVTLTPLGTYATGAFDEGASEIVAHDPATQRVFVVNAQAGTVDVLDISEPTAPEKVGTLATPGANSVAVHDGLIAVAEQAATTTDPGTAGDLGPEGLHFVAAQDSPTGEPLLIVGNEVSGTTTIWQVEAPGA